MVITVVVVGWRLFRQQTQQRTRHTTLATNTMTPRAIITMKRVVKPSTTFGASWQRLEDVPQVLVDGQLHCTHVVRKQLDRSAQHVSLAVVAHTSCVVYAVSRQQ